MKFETLAVLAAVVLAAFYPQLGAARLARAERCLAAVARRQRLSVLLCFAAALVVRVVLLPVLPTPAPAFQDDFSYLLAADTFAHAASCESTAFDVDPFRDFPRHFLPDLRFDVSASSGTAVIGG